MTELPSSFFQQSLYFDHLSHMLPSILLLLQPPLFSKSTLETTPGSQQGQSQSFFSFQGFQITASRITFLSYGKIWQPKLWCSITRSASTLSHGNCWYQSNFII
ncbi:hypothetical protein VIGAN_02313700 [Vigna angularis var. angularis]|uniref:Uncharacterized protein n=1 Tax=Vigna angularis var. angularis TaxID=157739 RepID=A0A0S3RHZ0_PHAAN|nr:hypothetical protein VIGAN_02313700 [Vigna angularis var. angularis]